MQHLTGLRLRLPHVTYKVPNLEPLSALLALRELEVTIVRPSDQYQHDEEIIIPGERLALALPHLTSLRLWDLEQWKVVVSCPKLTKADFWNIGSLSMNTGAALTRLTFQGCKDVKCASTTPETQFQKLKCLEVEDCSEVGKHLIQEVDQMKHLQRLTYKGFPAACMPEGFPQSLRYINLEPDTWSRSLPEGLKGLLKGLLELKKFYFCANCHRGGGDWLFTRASPEIMKQMGAETFHCMGWFRTKYICKGYHTA